MLSILKFIAIVIVFERNSHCFEKRDCKVDEANRKEDIQINFGVHSNFNFTLCFAHHKNLIQRKLIIYVYV